MTVRLRPETAVYPVDEGLLLCGWSTSALLRCSPGVTSVWRAIEPYLRAGVDPAALGTGPRRVDVVVGRLLETLREHDLVDAGAAGDAPGRGVAVTGDAAPALVEALRAAGVPVGDGPAPAACVVYAGGRDGLARGGPFPDAVAVPVGDAVLVGFAPEPEGRASSLAAALERATAGERGAAPSAITRSLATGLLVDLVVDHARGGAPRAALLVRGGVTAPVPLPPEPSPVRWSPVPHTGTLAPRDDAELIDRCAELVGPLGAPEPGELHQLPIARQLVRWDGAAVAGAGVDHDSAAVDAVLAALRGHVHRRTGGDGWAVGPVPVAGGGLLDVLADATGRLAVAMAPVPRDPAVGLGPRALRWWRAARGSGGGPDVVADAHGVVPGVVVARAATGRTSSWGYGATVDGAAEHALRGLTARLGAPPDARSAPGRVAVGHHADDAAPLLRALLGADPGRPGDVVDRLGELVAGLRLDLLDIAPGADGVLAGRVGTP